MKKSNSDKNLNLLKQAYSEVLILKRNKLNYTQKYTAEKCGISERQYSNIECQKSLSSLKTLANMRIALGIDLNKFVDLAVEKGYIVTDKLE